MELVTKAASQLNSQEMRVRNATLNTQRLEREDEVYKSYGILKYARKITEKDARISSPSSWLARRMGWSALIGSAACTS